jgi:hypothetical protein
MPVPLEAFDLPISSSQARPAEPKPSIVKTWAAMPRKVIKHCFEGLKTCLIS